MIRNRMRNRRGRLLDTEDFLHNSGNLVSAHSHYIPYPSTNVKHHEEYYDLEVALPGFKKEEIEVLLKDGILTISGEKSGDKDVDHTEFIHKEHDMDSFERSFQLGDITDEEKIEASFENGMLKIRLYHKPQNAPEAHHTKQIQVN